MKIKTQTFITALAIMIILTTGSATVFGQDKAITQPSGLYVEEKGNEIVGVWEAANVPAENDCVTGEPLPGTPTIKVMYSFNQGGTGTLEDNAPFDGPYRSTGSSIWKRTSGRNYTYVNWHYSFLPDKTFLWTIKQVSNLTLSLDGSSFTERGTFEGIAPNGDVLFSGCFAATAQRLTF